MTPARPRPAVPSYRRDGSGRPGHLLVVRSGLPPPFGTFRGTLPGGLEVLEAYA